jgi:hypothetical protein
LPENVFQSCKGKLALNETGYERARADLLTALLLLTVRLVRSVGNRHVSDETGTSGSGVETRVTARQAATADLNDNGLPD